MSGKTPRVIDGAAGFVYPMAASVPPADGSFKQKSKDFQRD
jgi:hypothetical protein